VSSMTPALTGLRVIEIARGISGPVASLHLAEAGAEVIKIEPPGGDPDRGQPGFAVWNRGKKSMILDPETAVGRKELNRLLASADVLIHDFTPAGAHAIGLNAGECRNRHPHLIVSAVTGWPGNHPDRELLARDTLVFARLGLMDEQPGHRAGPVFVRLPFASWIAAWLCAIGVLARLIHRTRTNQGGVANTSLAQGALLPMTMHWARAARATPSFAKGLPKDVAIAIHRCSDNRWIHVHYSPDNTPLMAEALARMGPEGVARANARWGKNHTAPNFGANKEIIATRPSREWLQHFWAHDVAAQPAAEMGEIYFDDQALANDYVVNLDDPLFGRTVQPGRPYHGVSWELAGPLRVLGSDTAAVLASNKPKQAGSQPAGAPAAPLQGLKVLDFGAYVAGPYGAMLLADLGADVIKVEPVTGDAMRYIERGFCGAQRGKRSLALQLADPRSRPAVEALVRWADVVHHNVRIPAARKLGIDAETLTKINSSIISCHVSAYGPNGPRADWPGFDQMFQSSCGWEVENGGIGNPPMWLRFGMTDHFAALTSVIGVLLAVYQRHRTRKGASVAASLLGATIWTTSEAIVRRDGGIRPFSRLNHEQTGVAEGHAIYRCTDGWIAVTALNSSELAAFRSLSRGTAEDFFATRGTAAAIVALARAGVPAEIVRFDQAEAFLNAPENRAANLVARYSHAAYGEMEQVGTFWDFGDLPLSLERAPPTIGQHSKEILSQFGFSVDQIADLEREGITITSLRAGIDPALNKRRG
jgi:crotonobetainyl-CoA:carnitine CoA-transferase CaiB-like acyl-CoA transferase